MNNMSKWIDQYNLQLSQLLNNNNNKFKIISLVNNNTNLLEAILYLKFKNLCKLMYYNNKIYNKLIITKINAKFVPLLI